MKNKMLMMFGAMAFAFGVSAHAAEAVHGDTTLLLEPTVGEKGDAVAMPIYVSTAFKINNSWGIVPELATLLGLIEGGQSKTSFSLSYFRTVFTGPTLKEFGPDRSFAIDYRFAFPVDRGSQRAGSAGTIKVRPKLSWKFNERFSVLARTGVSLPLQRNGYQIHAPTMGKPDRDEVTRELVPPQGNALFGWDMEIFPSYQITENIALSAAILPTFTLIGANKGATALKTSKKLTHEYSVGFSALGLDFAPTIGHESNLADFKLFTSNGLYYYVDIVKKF